MEKKFNKENVSEYMLNEITQMELYFGFNRNNGRSQINHKNKEAFYDYGRYVALYTLHEELFGNDKKFYTL